MSRRGGRVEEFEERYYSSDAPPPARTRAAPLRASDLLEVGVSSRRERSRDRQPEFLRQDYVRTEEQPLVLRKREVETFTRPVPRRSPSPVERERIRTRVVERQRDRSPSIERERTRTRVVERERERSISPPEIERVRTRVVERERDREPETERFSRTRIIERDRSRSFSPPGERIRTRVVERDRERSRERQPSIERTRTTTRVVERERERTPSPIRERERIRTREVVRERERSLSSSSESEIVDSPIIRAPPIHQEIITHHRHIDHGFDYAPAPTPPPPKPRQQTRESKTEIDVYKGRGDTEIDIHTSTKRKGGGREEVREDVRDVREVREVRDRDRERERDTEIDIHTSSKRNGGRGRDRDDFYDDDVLVERDRERLQVRTSHSKSRRRSVSARRDGDDIGSYESEVDYYARKTAERGYIGEAYNGATKDWAIVDVPPGTERVRMDGVGGGGEEITWQRYNGVRRSKFVPERDSLAVYDREREYEREEVVTDRRVALPPKNKYGDMWTEITKDLIVRESIEQVGYDYEETEFFYYIFQYLKYDDIQELVFISEDIRKARQSRIREIAHERDHKERDRTRFKEREVVERRSKAPVYDEERIYERDIRYESGGGGGRRRSRVRYH